MKSLITLTTLTTPTPFVRNIAPALFAIALPLAGLSLPAFSAEPTGSGSAGAAAATGPQRAVVEQKLRLLEQLANAPAGAAETPEAADRRAQVAGLVADARKTLAAGQTEQAGNTLDQAIKLASTGAQRKVLSENSHRAHLQDLLTELEAYRSHVQQLEKDPQLGSAAQSLRQRIDQMTGEAARHNAAGRFGDAHRLLTAANQLATSELGKMRDGKTVVVELKFDNPADEFAHEQQRLQDHQMLVKLALAEGRGDGDRRALVDSKVAESERLRNEAEVQARGGSYTEAVGTMEKASTVLEHALRNLGMPVF